MLWSSRRRCGTAAVLALALGLALAPAALAEDIYPYGSSLSHMYTHGRTYLNAIGAQEWAADSYARNGYVGDSGRITLKGWNNGGSWHVTGNGTCYLTGGSPGDCYIPEVGFDAGPGGGLPGSGSNDRYATAEHFIFWDGGSDTFYTSSDGANSSYACFSRSSYCPNSP